MQSEEREYTINCTREIEKAWQKAGALIRRLLSLGRKEAAQPGKISLNTIITDLEGMLHKLIGDSISLTTNLDPYLGTVSADLGQVEQILMNLVINARDAITATGAIEISTQNVRSGKEVRSDHFAMLAVSDTGSGIEPELIREIFEPFFTTKEKNKGTGLGLATIQNIVKESGGYIDVTSKVNQGTTFYIYLPLA